VGSTRLTSRSSGPNQTNRFETYSPQSMNLTRSGSISTSLRFRAAWRRFQCALAASDHEALVFQANRLKSDVQLCETLANSGKACQFGGRQ